MCGCTPSLSLSGIGHGQRPGAGLSTDLSGCPFRSLTWTSRNWSDAFGCYGCRRTGAWAVVGRSARAGAICAVAAGRYAQGHEPAREDLTVLWLTGIRNDTSGRRWSSHFRDLSWIFPVHRTRPSPHGMRRYSRWPGGTGEGGGTGRRRRARPQGRRAGARSAGAGLRKIPVFDRRKEEPV